MEKNVGAIDKIVRGVIGLAFIFVSANNFMNSEVVSIIFFVVGLLLIFSSMFGFCLLYKILGIRTNKKNSEDITDSSQS